MGVGRRGYAIRARFAATPRLHADDTNCVRSPTRRCAFGLNEHHPLGRASRLAHRLRGLGGPGARRILGCCPGGSFAGIYDSRLRVVSVAMTAGPSSLGSRSHSRPAVAPAERDLAGPRRAACSIRRLDTVLATTSDQRRIPRLHSLLVTLYLLLRTLLAQASLRDRVSSLAIPLAVAVGVAYLGLVGHYWIDWWGAVGAFRLPPLRPAFEASRTATRAPS